VVCVVEVAAGWTVSSVVVVVEVVCGSSLEQAEIKLIVALSAAYRRNVLILLERVAVRAPIRRRAPDS